MKEFTRTMPKVEKKHSATHKYAAQPTAQEEWSKRRAALVARIEQTRVETLAVQEKIKQLKQDMALRNEAVAQPVFIDSSSDSEEGDTETDSVGSTKH